MRHWWVNQNQTFRHEFGGGYLWSPKRKANGARNAFYESMREVAPGDLVLSFVGTRVPAIGIARSYCFESPKPTEFEAAGQTWENVGWRVSVDFTSLVNRIRPKDHIDILHLLLQTRRNPPEHSMQRNPPRGFGEWRRLGGTTPVPTGAAPRYVPRLEVLGFATDLDYAGGDDRLSTLRALSVLRRLKELGVPSGLITSSGYGSRYPLVYDNPSDPQNRWVEVRIK